MTTTAIYTKKLTGPAACEDARAYLANLGVFGSDGTVDGGLTLHSIKEGVDLTSGDVKALLTPLGGMANWEKVTTEVFTGAPNPFQVHFYRNKTTGKAYYLRDFTIRFTPFFEP
jgi:hypothetical protein